MSHQDRMSQSIANHQVLKQVVDWLLPPALFVGLKVRRGASWKARMLAVAALLWGASTDDTLEGRFERARKIVDKIFSWQGPAGETYEGFKKVLRKWHAKLMIGIIPHVQVRMREVLPGQWKVAGYVVFAGDGSRVELARTQSLEAFFAPKRKRNKSKSRNKSNKGETAHGARAGRAGRVGRHVKKQSAQAIEKKANSPQMWLTLLWHVGSGLPWCWRTGPSDSSEREHLAQMIADLPKESLITADAGFVGYDFWKCILDGGHNFLVRVGGNVKLLRKLCYARESLGTVYLWPDKAAKKKQPPLVLRLIVAHNGNHPVFLVTNLAQSKLSHRQAAAIYSARWGIELFFRTFKQTFGRFKLRSRCPENAFLELDWSLLALWCICLLGQRELRESGQAPGQLSAALAIRAFQDTLREWRMRPECRDESLSARLAAALLDDYERSSLKTSRNYPRKKNDRAHVGPPMILNASKHQITAAKELKYRTHEIRLAA
jgi:Transposase DDE domain